MVVTEPPGPLKFPSLGAPGMKTWGGMKPVVANLEHCRSAERVQKSPHSQTAGGKRTWGERETPSSSP